jgi:hypothetical protein
LPPAFRDGYSGIRAPPVLEPQALKVGDRYLEEEHMILEI